MRDETKLPLPMKREQQKSALTGSMLLSKAATTVQNRRTTDKTPSGNSSNVRLIAGTKHVVFGRGKGFANSPGNQRMHRIIDRYRGQYIGSTRSTKRRLLRQAYSEIIEGGVKVLKQGETNKTWVAVGAEEAMRKVGHSLRWRKGNIEESSPKPMAGPRIQDGTPTSDSKTAHPQLRQDMMLHEQLPLAANMHGLEAVLLQQATGQQLQQTLNFGIPLGALANRMRSSLAHLLEFERLQSVALVESAPIMQPAVTLITELQVLQAIQRGQELRRIVASRGDVVL